MEPLLISALSKPVVNGYHPNKWKRNFMRSGVKSKSSKSRIIKEEALYRKEIRERIGKDYKTEKEFNIAVKA